MTVAKRILSVPAEIQTDFFEACSGWKINVRAARSGEPNEFVIEVAEKHRRKLDAIVAAYDESDSAS